MSPLSLEMLKKWLRGRDLNPRPLGYEPNELPDCSTPRHVTEAKIDRSTSVSHSPRDSSSAASLAHEAHLILSLSVTIFNAGAEAGRPLHLK
jgi:hypothetical protein